MKVRRMSWIFFLTVTEAMELCQGKPLSPDVACLTNIYVQLCSHRLRMAVENRYKHLFCLFLQRPWYARQEMASCTHKFPVTPHRVSLRSLPVSSLAWKVIGAIVAAMGRAVGYFCTPVCTRGPC